jgi:hypothetical protein
LNRRMSVFIWFFLSLAPAELILLRAGPEETKNLAGEMSSA